VEVGTEGIIVKIQRCSIQDGPGIRTTIFLKGCPLRCLWCSNPETQNPFIELEYDRARCASQCYECLSACNEGALLKEEYITINREKCTGCGKCAEICYREALTLVGRKMDVEQVVDEVERDRPFYEESGGGVTLSGGEPLYQAEFAKQIAKECKRKHISTALDTSGYVNWKILCDILNYIDLVLYDIKHVDAQEHKRCTGVSNHLILENARRVSEKSTPLILRIAVIPGVNDTAKNLRQLADFANNLPHLSGVHLLPYHRIGASKYSMLGREYPMVDLQQPTKKYMRKIKNALESFGTKSLIVS